MNLRSLAHIEVLTSQGRPVFFGDLWKDRPAVIGFVRHFGCSLCFEQAADLMSIAKQIEQAGARLCVIGNGNPLHAQVFRDEAKLDADVYTDPARLLYRRLSMRRGVLSTFNPTSTRHYKRAYDRGFRQKGTRGDAWQQGGVLVVASDGSVAYVQRFNVAGDAMDLIEVQRAVRRCVDSTRG
jgi:peroxiredoxin